MGLLEPDSLKLMADGMLWQLTDALTSDCLDTGKINPPSIGRHKEN